eukprot:4154608-Prymnesium_polylepis.1
MGLVSAVETMRAVAARSNDERRAAVAIRCGGGSRPTACDTSSTRSETSASKPLSEPQGRNCAGFLALDSASRICLPISSSVGGAHVDAALAVPMVTSRALTVSKTRATAALCTSTAFRSESVRTASSQSKPR